VGLPDADRRALSLAHGRTATITPTQRHCPRWDTASLSETTRTSTRPLQRGGGGGEKSTDDSLSPTSSHSPDKGELHFSTTTAVDVQSMSGTPRSDSEDHPLSSPPRPYIRIYDYDGVPSASDHARRKMREQILSMRPGAGISATSARALRLRPPGASWSLISPSGIILALRARDFADRKATLRDIRTVLSKAVDLTIVPVTNAENRQAWWLVLGDNALMVASHLTNPSAVQREANQALRVLAKIAGANPAD
jgi:hypothetical protein